MIGLPACQYALIIIRSIPIEDGSQNMLSFGEDGTIIS